MAKRSMAPRGEVQAPTLKLGQTITLSQAVAAYAERDMRAHDTKRGAKQRARTRINDAVKRGRLVQLPGKGFAAEVFVAWATAINAKLRGKFPGFPEGPYPTKPKARKAKRTEDGPLFTVIRDYIPGGGDLNKEVVVLDLENKIRSRIIARYKDIDRVRTDNLRRGREAKAKVGK